MNIEEANDNLIMLKYFLQEEGDENWEKYCESIETLLTAYEKEKEKNKYSVSNELLINYMNIARKNSNVYLKLHNKKQALEEYKRYKILKDMIDYLIYNKPSLYLKEE